MRALLGIALLLTGGCGSCVEDKSVSSEPSPSSPPKKLLVRSSEGGVRMKREPGAMPMAVRDGGEPQE